jgi:uncharacterized membrane protein
MNPLPKRLVFGCFGMVAALLVGAAVAGPVGQSLLGFPYGEWFYRTLSDICHQYPTRSFWIFDRPMAICSRCFSIYLGILLGSIFFLFSRYRFPSDVLFLSGSLLLIITVIDGLIQLKTDYVSNNTTRFFTGFISGIGVTIVVSAIAQKRIKNGK